MHFSIHWYPLRYRASSIWLKTESMCAIGVPVVFDVFEFYVSAEYDPNTWQRARGDLWSHSGTTH